jgi:hypothetical protein
MTPPPRNGPLVSIAALAACALALVSLSGCNAGAAAVALLLLQDDDDDDGQKGPSAVLSVLEFRGLENARSRPAESIIRFALVNDAGLPARISVEFSDLDGGVAFRPATLIPPLPGELVAPGEIDGVEGSEAGRLHRLGWNALDDLDTDSLRNVRLRFSGDLEAPVLADVLVGNDAPVIAGVLLEQESGGPVAIDIELLDSSADPVDVLTEYAVPGDPEEPLEFRAATTSGRTAALPSSPSGVVSRFFWEAAADLGAFDRPAIVRFTPVDRVDGGEGKTGAPVEREILLDSNRPPLVEIITEELLASGAGRRGVALPIRVEDLEADPVDLIIQWTTGDEPFPDLDPSLDESAAAREALLADPSARRALRIAALAAEVIEGPVDAHSGGELPASDVPASWVLASEELRGLRDGAVAGRRVELVPPAGAPGGEAEERLACGYSAARAVLSVDRPFDPAAAPGSILRILLGGEDATLAVASAPGGILQRFVWDVSSDAPGGGAFRLRVTPYDRVAADEPDGCGRVPVRDDPSVRAGDRGVASETSVERRVRGPFRDEDPLVVPLAPVDDPVAVEAGDVDGDGSADIAYVARGSNTVVVLRQTAPGVFDSLRLLDNTLAAPTDLLLADLDGDGDLDLAVTDEEGGHVLLIFQKPELDFFTHRGRLTAAGALARPAAIAAGDLDGDGRLDLVVADPAADGAAGGPPLVVFLRGAAGGYGVRLVEGLAAGREPRAVVARDLDGDGRRDLAAAGAGFFAFFRSTGGGAFAAPIEVDAPGADLRALAVLDLDGDGRLDLAAPDRAGPAVAALRQHAPGAFELLPPLEAPFLRGPIAIAAADLDGDGRDDFALADPGDPGSAVAGGLVAVFLAGGQGEGGFSSDRLERPPVGGAPPSSPGAVAVVDLDGDGRPEIASADGGALEVAVFASGAEGAFRGGAEELAPDVEAPPAALAAADMDGDGDVDLLTANPETADLTLRRREAGGVFVAESVAIPPLAGARGPVGVAAGDLDGDGRADIVTANLDSNDLTALFQDAAGAFGGAVRIAGEGDPQAFAGPHSVVLADVDGDGRLEVIAGTRFANEARVFRNAKGGAFPQLAVLAPAAGSAVMMEGPIAVAAADFDSDGLVDVATANQGSHNAAVFLQSRETRGSFEEPLEVVFPEAAAPVALAAGDIDGDGSRDLVVAALGDPHLVLALQAAPGSFTTYGLPGTAGLEPTAVALRDLDGDGRLDVALALAGDAGSRVRAYFQGEEPDFSDARLLDISSGSLLVPVAIAAADLDGDGEADLVSANRLSANVTAFLSGK